MGLRLPKLGWEEEEQEKNERALEERMWERVLNDERRATSRRLCG